MESLCLRDHPAIPWDVDISDGVWNAGHLANPDLDARFEFGLRILLDGLEDRTVACPSLSNSTGMQPQRLGPSAGHALAGLACVFVPILPHPLSRRRA